jgi:hypothetical protein
MLLILLLYIDLSNILSLDIILKIAILQHLIIIHQLICQQYGEVQHPVLAQFMFHIDLLSKIKMETKMGFSFYFE